MDIAEILVLKDQEREKFIGERTIYIPLYRFELHGMNSISMKDAIICSSKTHQLKDENGFPFPSTDYFLCMILQKREKERLAFDRAHAIFKLFKYDMPDFRCWFYHNNNKINLLNHYTLWRNYPPYSLSIEERGAFINFWKKHRTIKEGEFSISRFVRADFEPYDKYIVTQFVEVLESLMCPLEPGDTRYKFASRATILLCEDEDTGKRRNFFKNMQELYSYRSALYHGRDPKAPFPYFSLFARNNAFKCVRKFLDLGLIDKPAKRKEFIEEETIFKITNVKMDN